MRRLGDGQVTGPVETNDPTQILWVSVFREAHGTCSRYVANKDLLVYRLLEFSVEGHPTQPW
jgi:hypothetical protein